MQVEVCIVQELKRRRSKEHKCISERRTESAVDASVTHDFCCHDDVLIMVHLGSSLELSPEKSYFLLFPEISFLKKVHRLLV
jgi:hypothetical protein